MIDKAASSEASTNDGKWDVDFGDRKSGRKTPRRGACGSEKARRNLAYPIWIRAGNRW
eukprot:CAMPEP_0184672524 /NCGR_PEP_ID=MMETSP0308-20130426/86147_1 /TAXON_ID=38269 /ORGANISM="Gloeochaete witrockiana, Strain SAG 46.84" /LENGTH=57 /DNA_ID=CAMNT_0027119863 /DNA_START=464 /DNA_END=634 /DNA_ORIENTATION=-